MKRSLVFLSPPLSELVKPFLKNSINFLGDAFLKQLGTTESGSLRSDGLRQLENHLRLSLGDIHNLSLHDGSGLSRTARVSPELLLQYLAALTRKPYFRTIYAALPIAGIDGTLKNRMKGSPAEGTLRAKTGTLDGVYNLAGYVPDGKDFIPFVILTRTTSALASAARAAEDRIGAEMARIHHSSSMENESPYPYYPEHAGLDGI